MNKKALLVLTVSILSMSLASCGEKPQKSSEIAPSSEMPSSQPASSADVSSAPVVSSELAPSSQPTSSESPVTSSEAPLSSSELPVSSEAPASSSEEIIDTSVNIVVNMPSYTDSTKTYDLTFTLDDYMFGYDPFYFSYELAFLGFGNAIANQNKTMMNKFYEDGGFDHIYLSETYDIAPTQDSIAYAFAHKVIFGGDTVFVSIRGFNYQKEWNDNFNLGETGEHQGFAARADEVKLALEEYLSLSGYTHDVQLFISGYSRGGAVANLLAKRFDDEFEANPDSIYSYIYAYTFEAPRGGIGDDLGNKYGNIFNVINSGDLVTYVAPNDYGFIRYGRDIDLYNSNIDSIVSAFDPNLVLPAFVPATDYSNDPELAEYIIESMTSYEGTGNDGDPRSSNTREAFVNNYQPSIGYMMGLFFSLKSSTINSIKEGLANLSMLQKMALMFENGIYNFLKPYLDADGVNYDDTELRTHCNVLLEFLKGPGANILALMMGENNPLSRTILLHTPEVNYALLLNNFNQE